MIVKETTTDGIAGGIARRIKSSFESRAKGYAIDASDLEEWEGLETTHDHDSACRALFTLLHNIEALELMNGASLAIVHHICYVHCSLTEVSVVGERDRGEDFSIFCALASIPTVRKIHGSNIVADNWADIVDNDEISGQSRFVMDLKESTGCTSVQAIQLACSAIEGQSLGHFLSVIKSLKSFYYEWRTERDNSHMYEPRRLVDTLFKYTSRSLESLTLIEDRNEPQFLFDTQQHTLENLKNFRALKMSRLEQEVVEALHECEEVTPDDSNNRPVNWAVMVPTISPTQIIQLPSISSLTSEGHVQHPHAELPASSCVEPSRRLLRLVDTLPSSLETLVLHKPIDIDHLRAIFLDLTQWKEERLPNLRNITVKGKDMSVGGIEDDCRQIGIKFELQSI
ncbi:MAG: hypothetical protein Q9169_007419 [Polycauliona sp. 2 TL-2023]